MKFEKIVKKYNRGTKYVHANKFKEAAVLLREVLKEFPCKEAYTNLGNCYRAFGNREMSYQCYTKALLPEIPYLDATSKTHLHALNNLGLWHYTYGNDATAIACYETALKEDPKFWEAWWNCSTATLRLASGGCVEKFASGWEMYRARFLKSTPVVIKNKKEDLIYWDGKATDGNFIALVEQGIGDSIMWGRYLPLLAAKFPKIYVQCDPTLEHIFSDYNPVRDACETDAKYAYPICSLADHFPNLPPAEWLAGKFGTKELDENTFNVGIVWSGNSSHANDRYRSTTVDNFRNLANHCSLYSLSPSFKGNAFVKPLPITSWTDTGEYINALDLIITVDTSVAHLAASMGAKVWLIQPSQETDFRWGTVESPIGHSEWYPNVRIYNHTDFTAVFKRVEEDLCSLLANQ